MKEDERKVSIESEYSDVPLPVDIEASYLDRYSSTSVKQHEIELLLHSLKEDVERITKRNVMKEVDKEFEDSHFRTFFIVIFIYLCVTLYFWKSLKFSFIEACKSSILPCIRNWSNFTAVRPRDVLPFVQNKMSE